MLNPRGVYSLHPWGHAIRESNSPSLLRCSSSAKTSDPGAEVGRGQYNREEPGMRGIGRSKGHHAPNGTARSVGASRGEREAGTGSATTVQNAKLITQWQHHRGQTVTATSGERFILLDVLERSILAYMYNSPVHSPIHCLDPVAAPPLRSVWAPSRMHLRDRSTTISSAPPRRLGPSSPRPLVLFRTGAPFPPSTGER